MTQEEGQRSVQESSGRGRVGSTDSVATITPRNSLVERNHHLAEEEQLAVSGFYSMTEEEGQRSVQESSFRVGSIERVATITPRNLFVERNPYLKGDARASRKAKTGRRCQGQKDGTLCRTKVPVMQKFCHCWHRSAA